VPHERERTPVHRVPPDPPAGYSGAVSIGGDGRWVLVSGHIGLGADGDVVTGGMAAEARATFAGIARTLATCGGTLAHVVKIVAYVTELESYAEYAAVRSEVFGAQLPASSTVQVAGLLAGARIELEAVAFVPRDVDMAAGLSSGRE
jgi:2-iminobutanoate/2-iminopropanoate deaminase